MSLFSNIHEVKDDYKFVMSRRGSNVEEEESSVKPSWVLDNVEAH